ncbi:uncharacterized protein LOC126367148 [Pectinophora gossypiella]|nr:uncharacterized protein LOC126367148 [Pectinophora gossypiella]
MPRTRSQEQTLRPDDDAAYDPPPPTRDDAGAADAFPPSIGDRFSIPPTDASVTFSQESVAALVATLQKTQTEAFKDVLESVLSHRATSSTPAPLPDSHANMSQCKATYSGSGDPTDVEAFIDAVDSYIECTQISDANVVRGISMLLTQDAATWWLGIKNTISTWDEAKENLISAFGDRRPPHRLYLQLFKMAHDKESTDIFIARARALLARLPRGDLSEKVELDMVYGLLNDRIRRQVRREEVTTFAGLLRRAREIEDATAPIVPPVAHRRAMPAAAQPSRAPAAHAAAAGRAPPVTEPAFSVPPTRPEPTSMTAAHAPAPPPARDPAPATAKKQRPVCTYCKRFGHTIDACRKLANTQECFVNVQQPKGCHCYCSIHNDAYNSKSTNCDCYMDKGDHAKFNYRDKYSNECTLNFDECARTGDASLLGNDHVRLASHQDMRPIFKIEILGVNGTALIDTGAKHCIAGHTLYTLLLRRGHPLHRTSRRVKLADGHIRVMDVLTTTLQVRLEHTVISIPFLVFPDSDNNETLLGIDFISAAGVVLDFSSETWYFSKSGTRYKLLFEPASRDVNCASADVLRDDEGTHLGSAERQALAQVLVKYAQIFEPGGAPTPYAEHRIDTGEHPPIAVPPYRLTPVMNQRNEVLAIDLFGPLPEGEQGERWILLVEDTATRWVELFALKEATSEACARVLIEEYFMRYGLPRRIISDNGVQFISAVMRQCMSVLDVKQNFVPLYHPEANPAERKNRDLKVMLAQLVENDHPSWPKKLHIIRFALNSAPCRTTGKTPAYLTLAREMRSPTEVTHDLRAILDKDNFVPQITPYLRQFINSLSAIRERVEVQQDKRKEYADQSRRPGDHFQVGDLVLLQSHVLSKSSKELTSKFVPRRDGPYRIAQKVSPTTYSIARMENPDDIIGKYHLQDLTRYTGSEVTPPKPVIPKRKRGRPGRKQSEQPVQERGRPPGLEGEYIATRPTEHCLGRRNERASRGRMPARFNC